MEKTLSHLVALSRFVSKVLNNFSEGKTQSEFVGQEFGGLPLALAMG